MQIYFFKNEEYLKTNLYETKQKAKFKISGIIIFTNMTTTLLTHNKLSAMLIWISSTLLYSYPNFNWSPSIASL